MKTTYAVAAAILSLNLAQPAFGANSWYVSIEGGGSVIEEWEHTRTKWTWCGPEVKEALAAFEEGWAAFGTVGFAKGAWRVEFEGGYRENDIESYVKHWKLNWIRERSSKSEPDGELSEASAMINVIYDVPLSERLSLAVGLGAGADYARFKLATHWAPIDEEDWHFAYQGIAGVNFAITQATILFLNYRFMNVTDITFDPTKHVHLEGEDFQKQAASLGLRFMLAGPAVPIPVPQPTPAPVPLEREFMVFFGFNQSSLSDQAMETLRRAVGAVQESGSAAIRVVGHADRAGSAAYNRALSLRRARSVKTGLIQLGIAAGYISISGRGESEPLVPTADGVRESQNRRVHISF